MLVASVALVATIPASAQPPRTATSAVSTTAASTTTAPTTTASTTTSTATDATATAFDPGYIISDPLFFDFGTMTADDIQDFLAEKVPECSADSEAPCLRDYTDDVSAVNAIAGRCDNPIAAAREQTAAQIIATVATACEINPQVLLVTLQKEQGLVTADSVAALKYRKAMGYGCPDTAECNTKYYGFFQQVYWAARAFNSYFAFPATFRFQPNKTATISYSPKSGCESAKILLQNRATAALYNYTPYTPNAASLANPFETGDECSSYGNRNFSLYFSLWFGDPTLGRSVVSSAGSSYLVTGDSRWRLPTASVQLGSTLRPLGLSATVSPSYVASLRDGGALGPVVRTTGKNPQYYLLDGDTRYALDGCDAVVALGFSCDVPALPKRTIREYRASSALAGASSFVADTSAGSTVRRYLVGEVDGAVVRRQLLQDASASGQAITLDESVVARLPLGVPVVAPGRFFTHEVTGDGYVTAADGTLVTVDSSIVEQTNAWPGAGVLTAASIATLGPATRIPALFSVGGDPFAITADGAMRVEDPADWPVAFAAIDPEIAALFPVAPGSVTGFFATPNGTTVFELADGVRTIVEPPAGARITLVPAATLLAIPLNTA